MTLLKRIILPRNLIYIFFIFLHLFLLNINAAEWGDSYRILRASEHLRTEYRYPEDEKRPPLYSILLSIRPNNIDPILYGRIFMFGISIVFLYTFEKFLRFFIKEEKYINLGLLLLALNPVFLYWSIRVYADVFFSLLVLLSMYVFTKDKKRTILLGILSGLSILTRFEGYLLFVSLALGISLSGIKKFDFKSIFASVFKTNILSVISYTLSSIVVLGPWLIYRNPFVSSYFEEPAGRKYDIEMVWTYVVSLVFIFGFTSAIYFLIRNKRNLLTFFKDNIPVTAFLVLELLLILSWPAAIPRLFVPIIPFFVLILSFSIKEYFESTTKKDIILLLINIGVLFVYIISQYYLKLQFLIPTKYLFILLCLIQFKSIILLYLKRYNWYIYSMLVSSFIWSLSVIYLHKDNFISIKNAAMYVSENISGRVAYNDVSSVSNWYINESPNRSVSLTGYHYDFEKNALLTYESLSKQPLDYLLITNEHNTTMDIDLEKRPYLTLVKEFSYNVNGKIFSSRIVKLDKEYKYE